MSSQQFAQQTRAAGRAFEDRQPVQGLSAGMPAATRTRLAAGIVAVAPAVLLGGLAYHPYIATPADKNAIAAALNADHLRWAISHLATAVGSGLLALAFLAIRRYLGDAGEHRWSMRALPFMVMACTMFALLPAMEIGILAGAEAGADVARAQSAIDRWFIPILVVGAVLFLLGSIGFARAIIRGGAFPSGAASFAATALILGAVTRFVPLGAALYVGGAAVAAALWPLAIFMRKTSTNVG